MLNLFNSIIKVSIYLLVFLLPFFWLPFSFEAFEFNKQYLLFFLVTIAFFAWLARMILVEKEIRFRKSFLDIFILAFLFLAILSAVFSVDKNSSIFGFYGRFSDGLINLLSLGILYFLITNNVSIDGTMRNTARNNAESQRSLVISHQSLVKLFLWSFFFVILISYLSIFGLWAKLNTAIGGVLPQIMLQKNFNPASGSMEGLAIFLSAIVVLIIGLILYSRKNLEQLGYWGVLVLSLGLLIFIDYSSAWIVLLASLSIFLIFALVKRMFRENVNRLLLPTFFIIIAIVFLFINVTKQGLVTLPQEQVLAQRTSWKTSFLAATENIKSGFLGSGIGTFHYDFAKFKPKEFNQSWLWQIRFDRAGNHFSEILGTMGFLGLISYIALIGFFLMISWFILATTKKGELFSGLPLLMAFLALIIGQFFYYQNTVLAFTFWLILGLSQISWQKPVGEKVISLKDFPELSLVFSVLFVLFGLVILAAYFFGVRFYLADFNFKNAIGKERISRLERAVNFNSSQAQYKIVLAREYLGKVFSELQKPVEERDQEALSTNVYLAINYSKGGLIARNYVKGATELVPNRVVAWETLGMIYRDIQGITTGATEWAIKSFEKAIELEPTNPVLRTELGKSYLVLAENEKARAQFAKAIELKPDYLDAQIQKILIYEREKNLEEAIRKMEELVNKYPLNIEASFQLGRLYFNQDRVEEAISQFEKILKLMPNHSNALYSLGVAYAKLGQKEKAISAFEKVLELNPGNQDLIQKLEELKK